MQIGVLFKRLTDRLLAAIVFVKKSRTKDEDIPANSTNK